ncbi:MAG: hypothetical protein FWD71_18370 [Oscillospiraceae bacterium]|nr:hypothetical protein [Oscillospiraceae bacterium]
MATIKEIQDYTKAQSGFVPKSCWIAHVKEICGLSPKTAHNRKEINVRQNPYPIEKIDAIKDALRYYKMI